MFNALLKNTSSTTFDNNNEFDSKTEMDIDV
jgi:hypothetical protein